MSFLDDDNRITPDELVPPFEQSPVFGISTPSGKAQINGVYGNKISGSTLHIAGDAWIQGTIQTALKLAKGILFGFGSATVPSIAFVGDEDTGFYRSADGTIGFASNGVAAATMSAAAITVNAPITTSGGQDLVLNPTGGNIDMSGKTLTNVGGISVNPNRSNIVGPIVTTTDATPTVIFTLPTTVDSVYNVVLDIVIASNPNSGAIRKIYMVKNTNNVITTVDIVEDKTLDNALGNIMLSHGTNGTGATIIATPVSGTIRWFACAIVTRLLF